VVDRDQVISVYGSESEGHSVTTHTIKGRVVIINVNGIAADGIIGEIHVEVKVGQEKTGGIACAINHLHVIAVPYVGRFIITAGNIVQGPVGAETVG
jgi:hypothetical protein